MNKEVIVDSSYFNVTGVEKIENGIRVNCEITKDIEFPVHDDPNAPDEGTTVLPAGQEFIRVKYYSEGCVGAFELLK